MGRAQKKAQSRATGISNRPVQRERDEQQLPARGDSKKGQRR
jgi:hypothetical protein